MGSFDRRCSTIYLPKQGSAFVEWLDGADPMGARVAAEKMFTFRLGE